MAARVVDLPQPVGPVTSTNPWASAASWAQTAGRPSSARVGTSRRMARSVNTTPPRCRETLTRKRAVSPSS